MDLFSRWPAEVRRLAGGDKILTYGRDVSEAIVVATDRALLLPLSYGQLRLTWDLVVRATWEPPIMELSVQGAPGKPVAPIRVVLTEPADLPQVIRERVSDSIVAEQHVPLDGEKGARVIARRTEDDGVRLAVMFDQGLDPRDPVLRARADEAIAALRAQWGI